MRAESVGYKKKQKIIHLCQVLTYVIFFRIGTARTEQQVTVPDTGIAGL